MEHPGRDTPARSALWFAGTGLLLVALLAGTTAACADASAAAAEPRAMDWSLSGFATLGAAKSNRSYAYQRYVDDGGTFKRDSLLGLQLDVRLGREVSATLQVKLAAPTDRDDGVRASIAWGFLSWRPNNDLLLRAGKLRIPLYLNSERQDVGATFDTAHLPVEVYSQSPTNDFTGLSVSRSWSPAAGEVVLDAYWGRADTLFRAVTRHDLNAIFGSVLPKNPAYLEADAEVAGMALSFRRADDVARAALLHARLRSRSPLLFVDRYPFIEIPGLQGVGYYDTMEGIASGRVPLQRSITVPVVMLGADIGGPLGTRVSAEYGRRIVKQTLGFDSKGAYVSVRKRWGPWTPYFTMAMLRSTDGDRAEFAAVNRQRVPSFVPQADLINLLQEAGADSIQIFDQRSLAAGFSYRISPTSLLKAELQQVRVGQTSALIDPPPGTLVRDQHIRLMSLSYSLVF